MKVTDITHQSGRLSRDHHPHIAALVLDAIDWHRFRALAEDRSDVNILGAHQDGQDHVIVHVGCQSEEDRQRLMDAWS